MKNERLKQFAASFLIVLALLVSSVSAACTCASHAVEIAETSHCQPPEKQGSAHEHSPEISGEHAHETSAQTVSVSFSPPDECCCVQSAPRVYAKNESVKIEKQASAIASFSSIEFAFVSPVVSIETIDFAASFYLADSFHNLTLGRAPPRS